MAGGQPSGWAHLNLADLCPVELRLTTLLCPCGLGSPSVLQCFDDCSIVHLIMFSLLLLHKVSASCTSVHALYKMLKQKKKKHVLRQEQPQLSWLAMQGVEWLPKCLMAGTLCSSLGRILDSIFSFCITRRTSCLSQPT